MMKKRIMKIISHWSISKSTIKTFIHSEKLGSEKKRTGKIEFYSKMQKASEKDLATFRVLETCPAWHQIIFDVLVLGINFSRNKEKEIASWQIFSSLCNTLQTNPAPFLLSTTPRNIIFQGTETCQEYWGNWKLEEKCRECRTYNLADIHDMCC